MERAFEFQPTAEKARRLSADHSQDAQVCRPGIFAVGWKTEEASLPGSWGYLANHLGELFEEALSDWWGHFWSHFRKNEALAFKNQTPRSSCSQRRARRAAARCSPRVQMFLDVGQQSHRITPAMHCSC